MNTRPRDCCALTGCRCPMAGSCCAPKRRKPPRGNWTARFGWSRRKSTRAGAARAVSRKPRPGKKAVCVWPSRSAKLRGMAKQMLGRTLVTHQTGPVGKQVNRIYIEDGSDIETRAVSGRAGRPRQQPRQLCRVDRGRHGYRAGRRQHARENPVLLGRPRDRVFRAFHGRRVAFALGLARQADQAMRRSW